MDYHENMENYLKAKKSFFDNLSRNAFAITNLDDKNGPVMVQNCRGDIKNYSTRTICDYRARLVEIHLDGMLLEFNNREFATLLTGRFNISNLLAIYGANAVMGLLIRKLPPIAISRMTLCFMLANGTDAIGGYLLSNNGTTIGYEVACCFAY